MYRVVFRWTDKEDLKDMLNGKPLLLNPEFKTEKEAEEFIKAETDGNLRYTANGFKFEIVIVLNSGFERGLKL